MLVGLSRGMRIERLDAADEDTLRACHGVQTTALATDDPLEPPMSLAVFGVWVFNGWDSNPGEVWFVRGEDANQVIAWYRLGLPDLENQDHCFFVPTVHPAFRRAGMGRELLRHGAARATANGRTVLGCHAVQDSAGDAFARRVGAKLGLIEARRMLDLRTVPAGQFARLREEAAAKAAGYTVVRWTGPTPEEYLGLVADAFNAMNDAPRDEGYEDDVWDAERVRDRGDRILRVTDVRGYSVAALDDATGEMAGLSQVQVDPAHEEWGHQGLTAVTRPHRGHRLGLLTKAAMLEWLATAEPQIQRVLTGNADSNKHMIAVNETLGYQLYGPGWQFCEITAEAAGRA
jgi:GNAT superfamily N-acetyltransferase